MPDPSPLQLILPVASALLGSALTAWNSTRVARATVSFQRQGEDARRLDTALEAAHASMMRAREETDSVIDLDYEDEESGGQLLPPNDMPIFQRAHEAVSKAERDFNDMRFRLGPGHTVLVAAQELVNSMREVQDGAYRLGPFRPDTLHRPTPEEHTLQNTRYLNAGRAFDAAIQGMRSLQAPRRFLGLLGPGAP